MASKEELKKLAAYRAVDFVQNGMVIGLGSGSTARFATLRIGEKLRQGELHNILAIPTSEETAHLAREQGIPLTSLEEQAEIDLTIDGADEVDPHLKVIKGLGGFLLREKIVAAASKQEIIVVDESKLVPRLGSKAPVPVEVVPFGWKQTWRALIAHGASPQLRMSGQAPFITDEGNYIVDCFFREIRDPQELSLTLNAIPGVVENGLFLGLVDTVVVASSTGVRILER
ncbi:MAG: ribose-5-phosphate isomerase RpiA [Anaerolineae bacterium]|nr:ribose-5-phosphate isomerase RpiA [Anaerolineae bacterium]